MNKKYSKIHNSIYRIKIPIPKSSLGYINSYVILNKEELFVIDTGVNDPLPEKIWRESINSLRKDTNIKGKITFFITHMHSDHSGLLARISEDTSTIHCSSEDLPFIVVDHKRWSDFWEKTKKFAMQFGFPQELANKAISHHPGYVYGTNKTPQGKFVILEDGDTLNVGEYTFEIIKTPGHTEGHLCLYERNKKILFSGDHVLETITPNISAGYENKNPLGKYLESLKKIKNLEVKVIFPGHGDPFYNLQERVREIEDHHKNRLNEIKNILSKLRKADAYSIASLMEWDLKEFPSFDEFPTPQKWFAHSEAIAHLLYLKDRKEVKTHIEKGIVLFSLKN